MPKKKGAVKKKTVKKKGSKKKAMKEAYTTLRADLNSVVSILAAVVDCCSVDSSQLAALEQLRNKIHNGLQQQA